MVAITDVVIYNDGVGACEVEERTHLVLMFFFCLFNEFQLSLPT